MSTTPSTKAPDPILAAGVVLWRESNRGREVALVHRPKYDDWSLPKGKAEEGEPLWATAVRETAEETGHAVTLGRPLPVQRYQVNGRPKDVHYWSGRAGAGRFTPHAEGCPLLLVVMVVLFILCWWWSSSSGGGGHPLLLVMVFVLFFWC